MGSLSWQPRTPVLDNTSCRRQTVTLCEGNILSLLMNTVVCLLRSCPRANSPWRHDAPVTGWFVYKILTDFH